MARKRRIPASAAGGSGAAKKHPSQAAPFFPSGWRSFIFPALRVPAEPYWRHLPALLLLAFILRAAVALSGDFVIHPDEIMQYLEPAHGLVFGNSVSYWEYYYGARSWLVPSMVAALLLACSALGLDSPAFYIAAVKLFFCALSLLVPLSLYVLGRRMFGEATGRAALLLGVFWYELVGFAHKPMTEFVATPLLLALMLYVLRPAPLLPRQAAIGSALGVAVAAVRFQYAPVVAAVLLVPFLRAPLRAQLLMVAAAIGALAAVGIFDYLTWGGFLHSYVLNFKVNVVLNEYRAGESSAWNFIGWLAVASGGLFLLSAASMLNYRRRLFLLLLCAAVLLPHMTQAHREYRFIFALLPFWLLAFADLLAVGWQQRRKSAAALLRPRLAAGCVCAVLVSLAGIANALPLQSWVYEAKSAETGYVHFLRDQDEIFSIYRMLAADDSVRGVQDITRPYFNGGGYYYLHRKVPFYSQHTITYPPGEAQRHVSHIVAYPMAVPVGIASSAGRYAMQTRESGYIPLPGYVSDASLGRLVYWDARGQATPVEGFALLHEGRDFTIWKRQGDAPVRQWREYRVAPDSRSMYPVLEKAVGSGGRQPAENYGIEFADGE